MNNLTKYYSIQIACTTLISYLLIFILTVFHFHHIELGNGSAYKECKQDELLSQVSLGETGCIVLQNFNSLHSLTISNTASIILYSPVYSGCLCGWSQADIQYPHLSQVNLRAPPLFS
jgi:hypothetical protein